jgi:small subunit ribosomal protein S20
MANHKSAEKRIRQSEKHRLVNRYYGKTMRNAIRDFKGLSTKKDAEKGLKELYSLIDKNAKRGIIHKNKAANLKSKLTLFYNKLS